jgi:predicted DNA-binding protein
MLCVARSKPDRPRRSRTYRLPDDLISQLEAAAEKNRRPVTTELEMAVEAHLQRLKMWPLMPDADPPPDPPARGKR